jgi:murein DD-endopeptidase MepM/ murein hydrolase activator NlpD
MALAALGLLATGVAWAVGADLPSPLDSAPNDDGATAAGAGAGASVTGQEVQQEDPSSLAITSDSGPYHPVAFEGEVDYGEVDAKFGASRYGHSHEGQDMFAKSGTPLVSIRDGVVVDRGNDGGRGNYIGIYSPETEQTYVYLHMLKPTWLKPGDRVLAGQQVGGMGCTGSCFGTHLHFEIRRGDEIENKAIDPLPSLKKWPQAPPLEAPPN